MYLLHKLTAALIDLRTALDQRYPDGAMHAAHNVSVVVHRLHQTRPPDHEMGRTVWKIGGEPCLRAACRVLASMHKLRDHVGLSGLSYRTDWMHATVCDVVRYLDYFMGPIGGDGPAPAPAPAPAPGPAPGAAPCSCGGADDLSQITPVQSPTPD